MNRPPVTGSMRDCSKRIRTGPAGGAPRSELRTTPRASIAAAAGRSSPARRPATSRPTAPRDGDGTQVVRLQTRHDDDPERAARARSREDGRESPRIAPTRMMRERYKPAAGHLGRVARRRGRRTPK